MTDEPEVITFKEFVERNRNIKEEELHKVVLVCKNCSHKDLLKNFMKKKPEEWRMADNIMKLEKMKQIQEKLLRHSRNQMNQLWMNNQEYENLFYCPKCGSSLVVLDKDFIKNNMLRGLNENKKDRV